MQSYEKMVISLIYLWATVSFLYSNVINESSNGDRKDKIHVCVYANIYHIRIKINTKNWHSQIAQFGNKDYRMMQKLEFW